MQECAEAKGLLRAAEVKTGGSSGCTLYYFNSSFSSINFKDQFLLYINCYNLLKNLERPCGMRMRRSNCVNNNSGTSIESSPSLLATMWQHEDIFSTIPECHCFLGWIMDTTAVLLPSSLPHPPLLLTIYRAAVIGIPAGCPHYCAFPLWWWTETMQPAPL